MYLSDLINLSNCFLKPDLPINSLYSSKAVLPVFGLTNCVKSISLIFGCNAGILISFSINDFNTSSSFWVLTEVGLNILLNNLPAPFWVLTIASPNTLYVFGKPTPPSLFWKACIKPSVSLKNGSFNTLLNMFGT